MAIKASATITLSSIRDLQSCTRYYLLQSSTLSPPSKPTAKPPGGNWVTVEPSYTAGSTNSLYFCDLNVFSDGDYAYSDVSLSSSYEAAKAAYNKAQTAQSTAERALSNTEVIVGTQTAATGAWTGRASFNSLVDGQQIVYWLPYAGSGIIIGTRSRVCLRASLPAGFAEEASRAGTGARQPCGSAGIT